MGKRKSSDYDAYKIKHKIRKLEKILRAQRRARRKSSSSSEETSSNSSRSRSRSGSSCHLYDADDDFYPESSKFEGEPTTSTSAVVDGDVVTVPETDAVATTSVALPAAAAMSMATMISTAPTQSVLPTMSAPTSVPTRSVETATSGVVTTTTTPAVAANFSICADPASEQISPPVELLQILGEDPSQEKKYGKSTQKDLAIRLEHLATRGLAKETRKELLEKFLVPENCKLISAPMLNPETETAINEVILRRDKGIELRQKQRAATISALAETLNQMMTTEPMVDSTLYGYVWDALRLLCDSQAADSEIRRSFVLNSLRKDIRDKLQNTRIDTLLFGEGLADTLKAAKAISKSGSDIKQAPTKQHEVKKKQSNNLNWRAPAPSHRPRGTYRRKEPATQNRHAHNHRVNSSKKSSRPAQTRR